MLTAAVQAGDSVWVVKVSKRKRLYPQRLPVLAVDTRRICVASGGRRVTWPHDSPNFFISRRDAQVAASRYLARLARRRGQSRVRTARAA